MKGALYTGPFLLVNLDCKCLTEENVSEFFILGVSRVKKYKRILLKLSGEALAGEQKHGIDVKTMEIFCHEIKQVSDLGIEIGVVIGGGNIHRGVAGMSKGMNRTISDHMGMLATIINSLALQDALERVGVPAVVLTSIEMNTIAEPYTYRRAIKYLQDRKVVIFAGGTGNPYFTTDTTAALRANEIDADVVIKATKVDGVYDKDPCQHSDAVLFDQLSYIDVLNRQIKVMDSTAVSLCMDNKIDIVVFNVFGESNLKKVIKGERIGTIVSN